WRRLPRFEVQRLALAVIGGSLAGLLEGLVGDDLVDQCTAGCASAAPLLDSSRHGGAVNCFHRHPPPAPFDRANTRTAPACPAGSDCSAPSIAATTGAASRARP